MAGVTASITRLIAKDAPIFRQSGRGRFIVIRGPDRGESLVVGQSPISNVTTETCPRPRAMPTSTANTCASFCANTGCAKRQTDRPLARIIPTPHQVDVCAG
jgi:hypothetical protein